MHSRFCTSLPLALALSAAVLQAADPTAVWQSIQQPAFDAGKTYAVANATLARDRIRLTLAEGQVQFTQPVEGLVFGAAFAGRGRVEVQPPNATEANHLRLHTGVEALNVEFTEAVFVFSDGTFEELTAAAKPGGGGFRAAEMYLERQKEREDVGAELVPRLFQAVLSADRKRAPFFAADLKTREKGWIHVRFDALELEEITVGRWANWGTGITRFENWLSFPADNRTPGEAYRDPLARRERLVKGYRINVDVTNGTELRATAAVTLEHRVAGERLLRFDLDSNLRVESVKDAQGAALPFFQPRDPKGRDQSYGDYVAVALPAPGQAGQALTLEFKYAGKRVIEKVGAGNFFCQSFGWYPTDGDSFAHRVDFELNFRSPKRYKLVATGNKVSETVDGDVALSTWKSDLPLAVAGFAFGDYKLYEDKANQVAIEIYANREADDSLRPLANTGVMGTMSPAALAKTMGIEMANTIRVFESYFGPYPYKRLAVTNIPYSYGQGWPMLIYLSALSFLDSTQRNAIGIKDHRELTDFFRGHEASHQWWGHRVGWKSYHDQWLSEGFAQFSGNLYTQYRENWNGYLARLRKDKEELLLKDQKGRVFESLGPVVMGTRLRWPDAPGAYSNIVYNKGGFILHMLRMMLWDQRSKVPDERFMALMRDFCQTYHNKPASTEDFKAVAEKHVQPIMDLDDNGKLDWFFRQYVYGTGVPRYQLKYTVKPAGDGKFDIAATVTQSNVPEGWKDCLAIYMEREGKTVRLGHLKIRAKEAPLNFQLPFKPDKLLLNWNEDTLAEVKN